MTFVSSVHNPKIMLGMLVEVLCSDSIATRRRLPRKGNVTFEDLIRGASDFDVRTVTVQILTSVRYRLPMTVGIVSVITTIRSVGLSCSHETFCIEVGALSLRACRNTLVVGRCRAAFCTGRRVRVRSGSGGGRLVRPNALILLYYSIFCDNIQNIARSPDRNHDHEHRCKREHRVERDCGAHGGGAIVEPAVNRFIA